MQLQHQMKIFENAEIELKDRDDTIKKLRSELDEKNKVISNYTVRIDDIQEELTVKITEIQYKTNELRQKDIELKTKVMELEELRKLLAETQNLYESEQRKVEKHKAAILQRNNKIVELESYAEKQKAKVMSLEARLESTQNEVKRKTDELQTLSSPVRRQKSTITDVDSFLVQSAANAAEFSYKKTTSSMTSPKCQSPSGSSLNSPNKSKLKSSQADDDRAVVLYHNSSEKNKTSDVNIDVLKNSLSKSKKHIMKLEQDQIRACKLIQSMLDTRRDHFKKIDELQSQIREKDNEIVKLQESVGKLRTTVTQDKVVLHSKIPDLSSSNFSRDTEVLSKSSIKNKFGRHYLK